ncbi:DnaJ subfamily C member like [Actinidia chinensis var. chinensis]|uniref:DnaJ subfamily C member like n=1 Tax=Actinidia chinensis var. chinensis TaxID=1590841 RepID=A0A2R6PNS6_ACTCC|nr:DnaJ subfamily C member like [Actinidia chinensis var. chinensis]
MFVRCIMHTEERRGLMFDPWSTTMATSPSLAGGEKRHWWLTNRKIVYKYVKDARVLIATQEQSEIGSALNLLDAALTFSPRLEVALELKARSLLCLRRFKDVADMLQDYIPSLKMAADDSSSLSSDNSSQHLSRERVNLLSGDSQESKRPSFKCFSVSDLKKKVMAGLCKSCDKEGQWRYLVLGQACCHLGLMEDAMLLLQTGKRLATAAFRRESICWSEDSFYISEFPISGDTTSISDQPPSPQKTESESISQLLSHIKLLLRRKTAAIAALDAGLYSEAIRHFSKIVEGRRGAPQAFLAECYMYRASAYRSTGRITESIADCNRTLALDPTSIEALSTRASLFETIRCLPDSLHDLEHLKLLYNSILRDQKLPGPAWKRHNVRYREIPGKLCSLAAKIQQLKQRVASGETGNVDYYALIGLRRGCSRSELERAHLLLTLRHKPDKANSFIDRCEFADQRDVDSVRDRAKLSALLLYRLIQKGYTSVMTTIMDEESVEKQRKKAAAALEDASIQVQQSHEQTKLESELRNSSKASSEVLTCNRIENKSTSASVFQGVFCRDLAVVGNLLSQVGFNRPIPVKYEALSC